MKYWEWPEYAFAGLVIFIVLAFGLAMHGKGIEHDAFMADCLKDHKQYECTAMWRAGESHNTVMPIIMPVPTR